MANGAVMQGKDENDSAYQELSGPASMPAYPYDDQQQHPGHGWQQHTFQELLHDKHGSCFSRPEACVFNDVLTMLRSLFERLTEAVCYAV